MPLQIVPYTADAAPAVREFNARLLAGGAPADQQLPDPRDPILMPCSELFVAMDQGKVRGGALLLQPIGVDQARGVLVGMTHDVLQEGVVE